MGYRIDIDHDNCINCGVCMDVCPVQALDMTRPDHPGIEAGTGGAPLRWTMEYPIQVGECIGCSICIRECPVEVMDLVSRRRPDAARRRARGRSPDPSRPAAGSPGPTVTREALKPTRVSPFDDGMADAQRPQPWQVWTTMVGGDVPEPVAPCQTACPAGTDAGRYVGLIAQGRYGDAYAVAAEVNPFPSVCGWICTAPCEAACRRGTLDEPIAIRTLKRFAAEHGTLPPVDPPTIRRPERVAIVGGGPAGMSAAYYLVRLGYGVTVLEAMPIPGGMMAIGIPEYRLPREMLRAEIDRIVGLGVDLRLDAVMGRDYTLSDLEQQGFQAIFLATGAPKSRRLGVPGDESRGVIPATVFLKQVNLGEQPRLSGPRGRRRWRQHRDGCRAVRPAQRCRVGHGPLSTRVRGDAGPGRGGRGRPGGGRRLPDRHGRHRGRRCRMAPPMGSGSSSRRRRATSRAAGSVWAPVPGTEATIAAVDRPRRGRRGARSVDPARRRRHRDQRLRRDRRRPADPVDRSRRRLRRRRRRLRTEDDHRRRRCRPSRRRGDPRVPVGCRDGEAEIMATVRYRTPPETSLRSTSSRERGLASRSRSTSPDRSGPTRPGSTRRRRRPRRRAASDATPSTAAPR